MKTQSEYDVIVVGGGAAGVGAAVGASQAGARTLLVESGPCLGGAATQKNVLGYCGLYTQAQAFQQAVAGVAQLILEQLRTIKGVATPVRVGGYTVALVDPEAAKLALDQVTLSAGVQVLLHTSLVGATRVANKIQSISIHDHRGSRDYTASVFVDASGEGDLAAYGGANVQYGDHGSVQAGTLSVRFGGTQSWASTESSSWADAILKAKQQGATLLDKEEGTLFRVPISGDVVAYMIDACYDALDSQSISQAETMGRQRAWAYLDAIKAVPGYEKAYIVSSGPNFGTRQSRRVIGKYKVTEQDLTGGARQEDVVALGAWPMEYHPGHGEPVIWKQVRDQGTFDIPLRALTSVNTDNLYSAGRLVDGDKSAGAAMRVMGTSLGTGHAAGVAAALQAHGNLGIRAVQAELRRQGAILDTEGLPTFSTGA